MTLAADIVGQAECTQMTHFEMEKAVVLPATAVCSTALRGSARTSRNDIKLRLCIDEHSSNENMYLKLVDIYVQ